MKKKVTILSILCAVLALVMIGGTIAYFTATDSANNTFTVGSVKIQLVEQQRNEERTALEPFEDGGTLMPIIKSAQAFSETVDGVSGLPTDKNYVDKIITVKNTGKSDAYVKVFLAVPAVLDNVGSAAQNILHFNWNDASEAEGQWTDEKLEAQGVTINEIQYNIYSRIYTTALATDDATATPAYVGFYLDKNVDMNAAGQYIITRNSITSVINFDFANGVTIPVFAQAIQAEGFDSAEDAFAQSGLPTNPWA